MGLGFPRVEGKASPGKVPQGAKGPVGSSSFRGGTSRGFLLWTFKMQMLFSKCRYLESELLPS